MIVDKELAPWVRRIYARYLAGWGYKAIASELEANGVSAPAGGELWDQATVRWILMNPVYAGLIQVGDELIEATHEAIIDRETWEKALALQKAKASTHKRGRPSAGKHLFRKGFLKCGICGEAMGPLTYRHRSTPKSQVYRCCGRARRPHTCEMSTIARGDIDDAVYAYFRQLDFDVEATREQLTSAMAQRLAEAQDVLDRAQQEAQAAQQRLERIKRDYLSGQLSAAEWRELKAELEPKAAVAASGGRAPPRTAQRGRKRERPL